MSRVPEFKLFVYSYEVCIIFVVTRYSIMLGIVDNKTDILVMR